jgi:4-hydroxybenzoyl-CoA reductase subunit beta
MSAPRFELTRVATVREACAALAESARATVPLAGGTQLLLALKNQTRAAERLVDLSAIAALDRIVYSSAEGLRIGAGVTLARLAAHPDVQRHYPALVSAARSVGTFQLQTMGTVGGNLCQDTCCLYVDRLPEQRSPLAPCHKLDGHHCHVVANSEVCWANYAGDLAPVLLALDATIDVSHPLGEDTRRLEALFSGDGTHPLTLAAGELVTAIRVPARPPRSGAAYLKLRQRESLDYPLLGVAASVALDEDGTCAAARVALTGIDRAPVVVTEAGILVGHRTSDSLIDQVAGAAYRRAHPVKNAWGYAVSYRLNMTRPFAARALRQALAGAGGLEVSRA